METLGHFGDLLAGIGSLGLALLAIVAGWQAVRTYRKQVSVTQAQWLTDLQKRFCEEPCFQAVRKELYSDLYNNESSSLTLAVKLRQAHEESSPGNHPEDLTDAQRELLMRLDDYLDFLGMIQNLVDWGELSEETAYEVFGWYALTGINIPAYLLEIESFPNLKKFHDILVDRYNRKHPDKVGQYLKIDDAVARHRPTSKLERATISRS